MVHGPDFYIRFVTYTFGDEFLIIAPTVALICAQLAFMLLVFVMTGLWFHLRQKKRAVIMVREANTDREVDLIRLKKETADLKFEVKRLNALLIKRKEAAAIAEDLIKSAGKAVKW